MNFLRFHSSFEAISLILEFHFRERVTGVLLGSEHVLDFGLFCIERKAMSESRFRVIELQRQLVELVSSVGGVLLAAIAKRGHLRLRHRREVLSDLQILVEYLQAVDRR